MYWSILWMVLWWDVVQICLYGWVLSEIDALDVAWIWLILIYCCCSQSLSYHYFPICFSLYSFYYVSQSSTQRALSIWMMMSEVHSPVSLLGIQILWGCWGMFAGNYWLEFVSFWYSDLTISIYGLLQIETFTFLHFTLCSSLIFDLYSFCWGLIIDWWMTW